MQLCRLAGDFLSKLSKVRESKAECGARVVCRKEYNKTVIFKFCPFLLEKISEYDRMK